MTTTIEPTATSRAARAAGVCPPSGVTLSATAIPLGTLEGWRAGVSGVAVDEKYVYAVHGYAGIQNGHDTPGKGDLVVFDREQLRSAVAAGSTPPERRITVGKQPRSVASLVRADYERVFVVNYHQDSYSVTVLNRKTWALVAETTLGQTPIDVAVHAARGRAYVTNAYHGIQVLDARTGKLLPDEHIEIERELIGLAVDESSDTLFVAHSKQYQEPPIDQLVIVDLKTRAITHRVPFRAHSNPLDVAYDAVTGTIYVSFANAVNNANQIAVLAIDRKNPSAPPGVLGTTAGVLGVAVGRSAAGAHVYAAAAGRIDVLDPVTKQRVSSTTLANHLGAVAVDRLSGEIYAGDLQGGKLFRLAPVLTDSPIGQHPLVQNGTLGSPLEGPRPGPDGQALVQRFQHGVAVATADYGAVAVRHGHENGWLGGSVTANGRAAAPTARLLGNPAADSATINGVPVTYFENGVTVTRLDPFGFPINVVVSGAIWQRYKDGGDVTGGYGLPLGAEVASPGGGGHQQFEHAVLFHRGTMAGAATAVVRGPVWDAWNAQHGGVNGPLGFPSADLVREFEPDFGQEIAQWLPLERGALVWDGNTGAVHALSQRFWQDWQAHGGPTGMLGMPLGSVQPSPHDPESGVQYVDFPGGVLVLYPENHLLRPPDGACRLARSLQLRITGFTAREADGPGGPLPDPYIDHWLSARFGAADPHVRWDGRLPGDDDNWDEVNEVPWQVTDIPLADRVRGDLAVSLAFHCWDFDDIEDDKLGEIEIAYTVDNFWGLDPSEPEEHYSETDEGSFSAFYRMMKVDEPIDLSGNFRGRYFWQFMNPDTPRLGKDVFSKAFTDVEAGFQVTLDPRDWVKEGWESIFYHAWFKEIAEPGNCYGMSTEAVKALVRQSTFSQPLYEHGNPVQDQGWLPNMTNAGDVEMMRRINLQHSLQLGDRVVQYVARLWMETLRGGAIDNGHRAWEESKAAYDRGDWPVFALMKEWKSGSHTVLPIRWIEHKHTGEKEIWLADPSKPPLLRDPVDVSDGLEKIVIFKEGGWMYVRANNGALEPVGSYNSGTPRWLVWIPMSIFLGQHQLPSVGAILDIVVDGLINWAASTVVGGDVDVTQITDAVGRTLYRPGLPGIPATPADLRSDAGALPGVYPVPVFGGEDSPVNGQFHYAVGRHDLLAHDVVPKHAGGSYVFGLRQGAMAASLMAPTDAHPDRILAEKLGSAGRSVGFARGKTLPDKTIDMMVEAYPRMPVPKQRTVAGERTRQFLLEDLTVTGGQQVVARPSDGGGELLVTSRGAPASFALRMRGRAGTPLSRVRRVTVEKDRTVVLRPAGWSVEALDSAPLPIQVRDTPDGPPVRCYEALPEGPAEV